jgi:hypothetical protein
MFHHQEASSSFATSSHARVAANVNATSKSNAVSMQPRRKILRHNPPETKMVITSTDKYRSYYLCWLQGRRRCSSNVTREDRWYHIFKASIISVSRTYTVPNIQDCDTMLMRRCLTQRKSSSAANTVSWSLAYGATAPPAAQDTNAANKRNKSSDDVAAKTVPAATQASPCIIALYFLWWTLCM